MRRIVAQLRAWRRAYAFRTVLQGAGPVIALVLAVSLTFIQSAQTRPTIAADPRVYDLRDFGGSVQSADNTEAIKTALTALHRGGGGVLLIPAGIWRVASASLGRGIPLPDNVTIKGAGSDATVVQITGNKIAHLFMAIDCNNIGFEGVHLRGNSQATGYTNGEAISVLISAGASASKTGLVIRHVTLSNFKAPFWINIENASNAAKEFSQILIEDVIARSEPGNALNPASVAENSAVIGVNGFRGAIRNVVVRRLDVDASHIKSGIIFYNQIEDGTIETVRINRAGVSGATDDAGGYAIQIYDATGRMRGIRIRDAVITAPRSVGIYVAGGRDVIIENAQVSGQTDRRSGTLPKGAIVLNGTTRARVIGGHLWNNFQDIHISPPPAGRRADVVVEGTRMDGSYTAINMTYFAGQNASGFHFRDIIARTTGTAVRIQNSPRARMDDVTFAGCDIEAGPGFRAMDLWVDSASSATGYNIADCRLRGTNPLYARGMTGTLRLERVSVETVGDPGDTAVTLLELPKLALVDVTAKSAGARGYGFDLRGSRGAACGLSITDTPNRYRDRGQIAAVDKC